jgi:hypothetical protein
VLERLSPCIAIKSLTLVSETPVLDRMGLVAARIFTTEVGPAGERSAFLPVPTLDERMNILGIASPVAVLQPRERFLVAPRTH